MAGFLVWLCTIDSCIAVAFTSRGSNKTLMFKSHEPVVDDPHELWEIELLPHEGCLLVKQQRFFNRSSDMFVDIFSCC